MALIAGGLTIADILYRNLKGKVDKREAKTQGDIIGHIDEVKNLTIMVNQARRTPKVRRKAKTREEH